MIFHLPICILSHLDSFSRGSKKVYSLKKSKKAEKKKKAKNKRNKEKAIGQDKKGPGPMRKTAVFIIIGGLKMIRLTGFKPTTSRVGVRFILIRLIRTEPAHFGLRLMFIPFLISSEQISRIDLNFNVGKRVIKTVC